MPASLTLRRFPAQWTVEEHNQAYFIERTTTARRSLTCISGRARRRSAAKLLTRDEARRIAANIAKQPDLLRK